ncbi:hypothetical protein R3Q06_24550 [Rhodococcus erythropolis]|uniref:hypothetical protein n=1 Tax=Rhodococcus erythropolis TaxID=1833 RepID=UPI00294A8790|nr:hypothetical protein [Rhodococcus erythropolis]MDV6276673.1 hypothetical protein [Rhodococcus erythropolis]
MASGCAHSNASPAGSASSALPFADEVAILQPGSGNVSGDHYLSSDPSDDMFVYLSAAADFTVSQVVDRTVGVHGQIFKSHFE